MEQNGDEAVMEGFLRTLQEPGGLDFEYALTMAQPEGEGSRRRVEVELSGPDAARMVERNGELLHAMESLAASILRLGPEEQDLVQFDALGFKRERHEAIRQLAAEGVTTVRQTGRPHVFTPMSSRERRMLHMALADSGLQTASSGEGTRRFVVVYPEGMTPKPEQFAPAMPPRMAGRGPGERAGDRSGRSRGRSGVRSGGRGAWLEGRPGSGGGERLRDSMTGESADQRSVERTVLPGERLQRLDPNGNPIETGEPTESAAALSERERLESLRRAFRKR